MDLRRLQPFVYSGQRIAMEPERLLGGAFERACYRLVLQLEGTTSIDVVPGVVQLRPGQLRLLDPGDRLVAARPAHLLRVAFDLLPRARCERRGLLQPADEVPQPPLREVLGLPGFDGSIPGQLHRQVLDALRSLAVLQPRVPVAVLRANATLASVVAALVEHHGASPPDTAVDDRLFKQVEARLIAGCAGGIRVVDVAEELGVSVEHLCRRYRAATGSTPGRFLMRLRIDRAKGLLTDSELPIGAVAEAAGFGHASSLRAAFRRETGLSPSAWRRRARGGALAGLAASAGRIRREADATSREAAPWIGVTPGRSAVRPGPAQHQCEAGDR